MNGNLNNNAVKMQDYQVDKLEEIRCVIIDVENEIEKLCKK